MCDDDGGGGGVSESESEVVVVRTSVGDIRGRVVSAPHAGTDRDRTTVTVNQFLGIPFAVPPLGQLRFADPLPLQRLPSGMHKLNH